VSEPKQELAELRRQMDEVNDRLVDSLGEFYRVADAIGEVKDRMGLPHQDLAREAEMKTRILLRNRGPLAASDLTELFNHILRLSVLRMEEGGKARLAVGRTRGAEDRRVAVGPLTLGDGTPLLGLEGDGGLSLGRAGEAPVATVADADDVRDLAQTTADALRVRGSRMYDYRLLREAGRGDTPVILERNPGATVGEWLHAAEYVAAEGNDDIALCEAGSLSFAGHPHPVVDLSAVALARASSILPVLVRLGPGPVEDRPAMAAAAVAAGACGIVVAVADGEDAGRVLEGLAAALSAA